MKLLSAILVILLVLPLVPLFWLLVWLRVLKHPELRNTNDDGCKPH